MSATPVTSVRSLTTEDAEHYDIVVSGGGMVGFAMASALGQSSRLSDRKIILLEGSPNKKWSLPEEYSNRVCALNGQTIGLFKKIGAWDHITNMRLQPVKKMQVWEACSEAMITFDHSEDDEIPHLVENDVTLDALKKQVPDNVKVVYESKVEGYKLPTSTAESVAIQLTGGETLTADLLIGADGAKSLVRETMGVTNLAWEYDQMGIVATLELSEADVNTTAWQRFLPSGPIALLPLSNEKSSLVWSTTREAAKSLLKLSDEDFIDAVNRAVWEDQGSDPLIQNLHERWMGLLSLIPGKDSVRQLPPSMKTVIPGSRAAFPLGLGHATHYVAPRVALIGDAAHRVHPLAGQGVNLGFGDVVGLLKTVENAVMQGADIGDERELYEYEKSRQWHNVRTMASIDGLQRLYSTTLTPLVLARSLGLSTVNALNPLKKLIMKHAEGS